MSNINFQQKFAEKNNLLKYIEEGNPLNLMDIRNNTLFMYVCEEIAYLERDKEIGEEIEEEDLEFYEKIALKMLDNAPTNIRLNYQNPITGMTALILVAGENNKVSLKILSYGAVAANINAIETSNSSNALIYSCLPKSEAVALKLLEFPSIIKSLDHIDNQSNTALIIACEEKLINLVKKMLEYPPDYLQLFHKNKDGDTALDIVTRLDIDENQEIANRIYELMREVENDDMELGMNSTPPSQTVNSNTWAIKEKPKLPDITPPPININEEGYDPFMLENINIKDYCKEDKDNIAIEYQGKIYLSSRSILKQQYEEGLVFECVVADIKNINNIVAGNPLFNIKKIGIDIPINRVGLDPEYIYADNIEKIIYGVNQYFSIIPLINTILVSVISIKEIQKIGTAQGSGVGALHCQAGQGGMAGMIVPTTIEEKNTLGGKKKRKTIKKRQRSSIKNKKHKRTNKK